MERLTIGKIPKKSDSFYELDGYKVFIKRLKDFTFIYECSTGVLLFKCQNTWDNKRILDFCVKRSHIVKEYLGKTNTSSLL